MTLLRRRFLQLAAVAAALPAVSLLAKAENYPSRLITMIVPQAAGTAADVIGRMVAERMRGSLGQPIIIENVPGADGSIGTGRAARARPDGYTIDLGFLGGNVLNGAFYSLQYDVLNDFAPVSPLAGDPHVLFARKTMPAKDLNELIAWLKSNPNKASMAVSALGPHVEAALFQKETGTHVVLVPYRGGPAIMQDLVAGRIDLTIYTPDQLPLMRAAGIKAYAVTGRTRFAQAPDIPTYSEMGLPALTFYSWNGLFVPKGTPRDIIGKLNAAAIDALADRAVRSRIVDLGYEVFPRDQQTPEALGALVKADAEKWWPIIKELGIRAE
jgi:tripartite-type tricarboxylate transporter receptor subunit TctC